MTFIIINGIVKTIDDKDVWQKIIDEAYWNDNQWNQREEEKISDDPVMIIQ